MIRIRLKIGSQTSNHDSDIYDSNIYDSAIPFAGLLVCWEFEFSYSYPNAECVFEILDREKFLIWVKDEAPGYEFDILA